MSEPTEAMVEAVANAINRARYSADPLELEDECKSSQEYARRLARAAIKALALQAEAEQGWQPIETAPKDGTRIIAYSPKAPGSHIRITWFRTPERQAGFLGWGEFNETFWPPTHWRPLPPPPPAEGDTA